MVDQSWARPRHPCRKQGVMRIRLVGSYWRPSWRAPACAHLILGYAGYAPPRRGKEPQPWSIQVTASRTHCACRSLRGTTLEWITRIAWGSRDKRGKPRRTQKPGIWYVTHRLIYGRASALGPGTRQERVRCVRLVTAPAAHRAACAIIIAIHGFALASIARAGRQRTAIRRTIDGQSVPPCRSHRRSDDDPVPARLDPAGRD